MKRNKHKSGLKITPKLGKIIGAIEKDIKKKKNLSPPFDSSEKIIQYLQKITF